MSWFGLVVWKSGKSEGSVRSLKDNLSQNYSV